MSLRLSLAQILLLMALVALGIAVVTTLQSRYGVLYNEPVIAVSPDGTRLASGHMVRPIMKRRHPITVAHVAAQRLPDDLLECHSWCVTGVAFSPTGETLYSTGDFTLRSWDLKSGRPIGQIDLGYPPESMAVAANGRWVATGASDVVHVWNARSQAREAELTTGAGPQAMSFSPDGKYLVTAEPLQIWETSTWSPVAFVSPPARGDFVFASPTRLVTSGYDPQAKEIVLCVVDIPSGSIVDRLPVDSWAAVSSLAMSPDGAWLAVAHGGSDRRRHHSGVTVWDFHAREKEVVFDAPEHGDHWIDAMVFSPDGGTLYCASKNNVVSAQHWRAQRAELLFRHGRQFPWYLVVGGVVWLVAWKLAPKSATDQRQTQVAQGRE